MITFIGKLNKSCKEKHTILIGNACRLCERKCMVCITEEKSLTFTDK